ncbi:MAG: SH3 domain-containing protein [Anaerolineae bacterium]
MRQLSFSRFVNLGLGLLLVVGIIGYVSSAHVPLAFARPQLGPSLNSGSPQAAALQTSNQLVVIAFSDTTGAGPFECPGCDKIFSSADQEANSRNPMPPMEFVVHNVQTGEELGRQQAVQQPQGRYQAIFELPGDLQDDIVLSLASGPAGFQLCPNASASRTIKPADFILGTHEEAYPFWAGCALQIQEPTATPVPTSSPTPVPPTATPEPTNTPLPERSIVVEAFVDVTGPGGLQCPGCDRIFSSADQVANAADPLPNMDFILRDAATGRLLARQTTTQDTQGRLRTTFRIPAGFDSTLKVELASVPGGFQLCPNVGPSRTVKPDDFILGTHLEQFPFWKGCEIPEPSPTPTTEPPASPGPTATAVVSPTPTPTTTTGGTLAAVVTAHGLNVRTGPGIEYPRLGAVAGGTKLTLGGRNERGTWVLGQAPEAGLEGWLSAAYMDIDGDVLALPVTEIGPPGELQATAIAPAATPTVARTGTVTPTATVVPDKLPLTGGLSMPIWGLLALAAAILLALSHVWRWLQYVPKRLPD